MRKEKHKTNSDYKSKRKKGYHNFQIDTTHISLCFYFLSRKLATKLGRQSIKCIRLEPVDNKINKKFMSHKITFHHKS